MDDIYATPESGLVYVNVGNHPVGNSVDLDSALDHSRVRDDLFQYFRCGSTYPR